MRRRFVRKANLQLKTGEVATVLVIQMRSIRSWGTDSPGHSTAAINGSLGLKIGRTQNHHPKTFLQLNRERGRIFLSIIGDS